jgi:hypothetical protein
MLSNNINPNLIKLAIAKGTNQIAKEVPKPKPVVDKPKKKISHYRYFGFVGENYPNLRLKSVRDADEPLEVRFGSASDCTIDLNITGGNSVNTATDPFEITFTPSYADISGGKVDANGNYTLYGMPDFYLMNVFNDLKNDFRRIVVKNKHVDETVDYTLFKPLKSEGSGPSAKYNVEAPKTINLFKDSKGNLRYNMIDNKQANSQTKPISVVITPYDKYLYAGYPIIFLFDAMGNKMSVRQTLMDEIKVIRNPNTILNLSTELGFHYSNYYDVPIIDNVDLSSNSPNEITTIYGMCNNETYGITFKMSSACKGKDNTNNVNSDFLFQVFPFSGFATSFPICLQTPGSTFDLFGVSKKIMVLTRQSIEGSLIDPRMQARANTIPQLKLSTLYKLNSNIRKNSIILLPLNKETESNILL